MGCGLTFLFFILTVICSVIVIIKAIEAAKNTITENIDKEVVDKGLDIFTNTLAGRNTHTPFMDTLRSMQPTDKVIPDSYLSYAGFRDYYRMPLIYPYSLNSIDDMAYGQINDESGISYIAKDANKSKQLIHGITSFTFDKKLLLAKTESFSGDDIKYILFYFETGQFVEFETKVALIDKAKSLKFETDKPWITIKEYYFKL